MPRAIAKDKEILNNIREVSNLLDDISDKSLINDGEYIKLQNQVGETYLQTKSQIQYLENYIDQLENEIKEFKNIFTKGIKESRWVRDQHPINKAKRAEELRRKRIEHETLYRTCVCGDQLSKEYYNDHLKTEKHAQRHMNLIFQKGKIKFNLSRLLHLNSHINGVVNGLKTDSGGRWSEINKKIIVKNPYYKFNEIIEINENKMRRINILEMLIKRWKIKKQF